MSTQLDEFVRATLGGARNAANGSPLTAEQIERVIKYLKSPGSGAIPGQSFEEWMDRRMAEHPPRLGAGMQYVAYSGVDQGRVSNSVNARSFVEANPSAAGTIGDTPWGRYIESGDAKAELDRIAVGLHRQLAAEGIRPFNGNPLGAAKDMMWNAGSPEFARNAMQSGRPLIAFVDGAPVGRGFSTFELPVIRQFPEGSINGHRVATLGDGTDSLENASRSAATYAQMERSVAASLGLDPDNPAHIDRMRSRLDLSRGFDAHAGTVFGQRVGALSARDLDGFGQVADEWLSRNPGLTASSLRPGGGPGMGRVGAAATGIGLALTVAEGNEAIQRSGALYDMGNATGARSELIHFGTRSVGAWGGAVLGAGVGAATTSPTGPGAIIGGIVGGAVGLVGGAQVAEYLDYRSIYRQDDADGKTWAFDPESPNRGWRRTETVDQSGVNGQPFEQRRELVASGQLAAQLDRQATTVSLELMLARPPVPRGPYSLPAGPGDAVSAQPSSWRRDPATGDWHRQVYEWRTDTIDPGFTTLREVVKADPVRAAQLEAQSQAILRDNVHLAPSAMAARYELAHRDNGWDRIGPLHESVQNALRNDGRLVASDGAEYQRQPDGNWERQALFGLTTAYADPTIRAELDATRALLQEGLREHRDLMAERPQPSLPTFDEQMQRLAAEAYAVQGLSPSEANVQTMGRALSEDLKARGLDGPFMLQLERDPITKQYGSDSPMGVYTRGADSDMSLRFTMTPQEARELVAEPQRVPSPPAPNVAPSDAAVRDTTALSPASLNLIQESEQQVRALAERHNLPWDAGLDNTVLALAAGAREQGLTGITHLKVQDGQIRFAQHDGFALREGGLGARAAANTDGTESLAQLAEHDQRALALAQAPAAPQFAEARTPEARVMAI